VVHDQQELKLGGNWAESFFLHESRPQGTTTVTVTSHVRASIVAFLTL
jgi:hypothetical protein